MIFSPSLPLVLALVGQGPPAPAAPDDPSARLATMKASALGYEFRPAEGGAAPFRMQADPALRFTNPVGALRDGAIFLWQDEVGRPAVASQIYVDREGRWTHEFASLSAGPVLGTMAGAPAWRPSRAGVEFRPIPDAPRPADSADRRLRQMQSLARDFVAEDQFRRESWQRLRMLSRPLARYGGADSDAADGALFALVLATDPEVYLLLESRAGRDGPEWHYALAPMTIFPVRASWKGKVVWERPFRWPAATSPDAPFFVRKDVEVVGGPRP